MKKIRLIAVLSAVILILSSFTAFGETGSDENNTVSGTVVTAPQSVTEPGIYAEAAVLLEEGTGKILYSKNADKKMYPASTTKIMTSMIFLEYFNKDDVIEVGTEVREVSLDSSKAGHVVGESITAENLVRGLIIPSGNDSAVVAACAVARKIENNNSLGLDECERIFSGLMNKKAEELGCTGTHFTNPHGYHDDDHYTTASDMAKIASEGMKNELIKQIVSERSFQGNGMGSQSQNGLKTQDYDWKSHNLLITNSEYGYEYANGVKTGFTDEAGDSVVASAEKDGVKLIAVIYNSEDPNRWLDAKNLFEYGFNNFGYFTLNKANDAVYSAELVYNKADGGNTLDLVIKDDIVLFLPKTEVGTISTEIKVTNDELLYTKDDKSDDKTSVTLKAPIAKDTNIGTVSYKTADGTVLAETNVYSSRDVEKANIFMRAFYNVKSFVSNFISHISILKVVIIIVVLVIIIILIRLLRGRRGGYHSKPKYKYSVNKRRRFK
ncbi:D-alanyl-D-alanine carboxypeptidase [Lachnospiraceae bacterium NSJ-143]|nr:D-alanyl-D-alanine carboxypeptidase [Lachnospiraceae bacterium NSJ-143]